MTPEQRAAEYLRLRDTASDLTAAGAGFAFLTAGLSLADVSELSRLAGYTPDRTRKATLARLESQLLTAVMHRYRAELIRTC